MSPSCSFVIISKQNVYILHYIFFGCLFYNINNKNNNNKLIFQIRTNYSTDCQ